MALENLLGNAWKYSARASAAQIRFETTQRDGRTVYCVSDNGAGFDMRFADRLFGVFQRLHSASDFAGTGVGLASVRRIIRRHGGEIWAESEVGQGARFYFTLKG
jgi:light-regulated signal transduction histidine kinase (bacteriophytochrome)